ncbi:MULTISPECIES: hypothetical protein [Marinomonas]|uniref:Uncharacterized protein n=1 Tax=Marinomonas rhodophyticola TaxID=2992803 RepID=A0ABT3KDB0_9GAMM|nr:hypothetical protein [Marinomonas sp. KJ51-3]MCW4628524.1 hypothetical protein [Marinomonas sp. KJ51-3]
MTLLPQHVEILNKLAGDATFEGTRELGVKFKYFKELLGQGLVKGIDACCGGDDDVYLNPAITLSGRSVLQEHLGTKKIKYGESDQVYMEAGKLVSFNVNSPTQAEIHTKGGTVINFLITPNNAPSIFVGDDIVDFNLTILERSEWPLN